jgi:hypothetical protein
MHIKYMLTTLQIQNVILGKVVRVPLAVARVFVPICYERILTLPDSHRTQQYVPDVNTARNMRWPISLFLFLKKKVPLKKGYFQILVKIRQLSGNCPCHFHSNRLPYDY